MKTVGEFKKAGVVFVKGDLIDGHTGNKKSEPYDPFIFYGDTCNWSLVWTMRSFAWRDLSTKPDNPQYKIELDIANSRWRPSLNQGVEYPYEQRVNFHDDYMKYLENARKDGITKPMTRSEYNKYLTGVHASAVAVNPVPSEFKVGDLVECTRGDYPNGPSFELLIFAIDGDSLFGYIDSSPAGVNLNHFTVTLVNPQLNELKDIIGTHDDPTECAKAILEAVYTK